MRLYFNKSSRATRPRWLLEEAGIPCEIVPVDMAKGEHKSEAYLRLHPHGQLPVLVDDDTPIFESAAITLYLADKAPASGLAPAIGTVARGLYYQWAVYAMATLEPGVAQYMAHTRRNPESERKPELADEGRRRYHTCLAVLTAALGGNQWLVEDRFTAADVLIGSVLAWGGSLGLNAGFPVIEAYTARCAARPAFAAARR
jgi:glutathione S-transferase